MEERRRFPRRPVENDVAEIPVSREVRVVDISEGGVMLHAVQPPLVGSRGALRLSVAGAPFVADVEIQRVMPEPGLAEGYRVGARFIGVTPESRQIIERFIAE